MKLRFSTLDVIASITELKPIMIGARIINIYDINNKTYLFKLLSHGKPVVILLESAIRIHTTEFAWPKKTLPSSFAMKLRKHLRNRQIVEVFQFGVDRVIGFKIGKNDNANIVVVELFDRGNIILCDWQYKAIALLRRRHHNVAADSFGIGHIYSIKAHQSLTISTQNDVVALLSKHSDCTLKLKDFLQKSFLVGFAVIDKLTNKSSRLQELVHDMEVNDVERIMKDIADKLLRFSTEISAGIIRFQNVGSKEDEILKRIDDSRLARDHYYGGFLYMVIMINCALLIFQFIKFPFND
ncbi:hypothetical protein GJ496_004855 [Pomphorhynchus laevis]|nr:hypothetical protein GJ496_004855 [Pomphorhynchus laevis]